MIRGSQIIARVVISKSTALGAQKCYLFLLFNTYSSKHETQPTVQHTAANYVKCDV